MKRENILIALIDVGHRKRLVREDKLALLMKSIEAIGPKTPITVARAPAADGEATPSSQYRLVAGAHGHRALRMRMPTRVASICLMGAIAAGSRRWQ